MKAQLRFLSGARAGQVEVFRKAYIGLGRHPLSDARFDAESDLDVSSRHAAIIRQGETFLLRDLGSKNGTLVNGQATSGDVALKDGDVIGFGPTGPALEFHILEAGARDDSGRRSDTARVGAETRRQITSLRRTTKVLLVLLVVSAAAFAWLQWRSERGARQIVAFQSELRSLRDALGQSQMETARLRRELGAAGTSADAATVRRLRGALAAAETRQRDISDAAAVDYRSIAHHNADAIALIAVKFSDVEVTSGTAFAVDSQGTLVTNKHVLVGEDGDRRPLGVAVKFSGSNQWFRGRLIGVSDSVDVGVLKVDIRGGTPKVVGLAGLAAAPQRGDPVAIIGYPLGEALPMEHAIADPTLTVGTVSKVLRDVIQVDGYGAPGSSGSPIFDRAGRVVGVLYGGERESQGKIIYAVPTTLVTNYLKQLRVVP